MTKLFILGALLFCYIYVLYDGVYTKLFGTIKPRERKQEDKDKHKEDRNRQKH